MVMFTPMRQYKIVFWMITGPLLIPMTLIVILAVINPLWFRQDMLSWTEAFAGKLARYRDETKLVKYYYDKAHLFDKLKA
jgi:hypothetical protein